MKYVLIEIMHDPSDYDFFSPDVLGLSNNDKIVMIKIISKNDKIHSHIKTKVTKLWNIKVFHPLQSPYTTPYL